MAGSGPMDRPVLLERRVLRDGVHDRLLEQLLDGSLAPNSTLSIDGLARELQVSPTPVREALAQLEHTGLVMRLPLRGYRVAPRLTSAQVHALVEARALVEHAALDRGFEDRDALVALLEAAHARQADLGREVLNATGDPSKRPLSRAYLDADWGFHQAILHAAGNEYFEIMGESLSGHSYRVRQSFGRGLTDVEDALRDHEEILQALRERDLPRAHDSLRRHLAGIAEHSAGDRFQ